MSGKKMEQITQRRKQNQLFLHLLQMVGCGAKTLLRIIGPPLKDKFKPTELIKIMQTQMEKTTASILTAASAPRTKESPADIKTLAKWLNLQTHDDPQIELMVAACGQFAVDFKNGVSPRWISLLGTTGTGKTHCARRLWENLKNRINFGRTEFPPLEIYWPQFIADLRAGIAYDRLRDMFAWPVLFLDDIGAERDTTGFASENLNTLLGCRQNRWTIITSNLMLDQIAAIDPRVADRMIRKPNVTVELSTMSHALRPR